MGGSRWCRAWATIALGLIPFALFDKIICMSGGRVGTYPFTGCATAGAPMPYPFFKLMGLIQIFRGFIIPLWSTGASVAAVGIASIVAGTGVGVTNMMACP